jgi:hypothetical protein
LINNNHFDPILGKLACDQNKIIADTLGVIAVNAAPQFRTGSLFPQPLGIKRGRDLSCP